MKSIKLVRAVALIFGGAYLMMAGTTAKADPPIAEDRAHQVAVKFRDRGFFVTPIDAGLLMLGQMVRVQIPVTRGLDYVILASGDEAVADIDIHVYSEVDTLILNDSRPLADAVVQFRSQYTGSVYAYIFMATIKPGKGLPSWAAFVCRRGTARSPISASGKATPGQITNSTSNPPPGGSPSAADAVKSK